MTKQAVARDHAPSIDVLPKNWTSQNWKSLATCSPPKEGGCRETLPQIGLKIAGPTNRTAGIILSWEPYKRFEDLVLVEHLDDLDDSDEPHEPNDVT